MGPIPQQGALPGANRGLAPGLSTAPPSPGLPKALGILPSKAPPILSNNNNKIIAFGYDGLPFAYAVPSPIHIFSHFHLSTRLRHGCYDSSHFLEEEAVAWRGPGICPRSSSLNQGSTPHHRGALLLLKWVTWADPVLSLSHHQELLPVALDFPRMWYRESSAPGPQGARVSNSVLPSG